MSKIIYGRFGNTTSIVSRHNLFPTHINKHQATGHLSVGTKGNISVEEEAANILAGQVKCQVKSTR